MNTYHYLTWESIANYLRLPQIQGATRHTTWVTRVAVATGPGWSRDHDDASRDGLVGLRLLGSVQLRAVIRSAGNWEGKFDWGFPSPPFERSLIALTPD